MGLCRLCAQSCEAIGVACPTCALPIAGPLPIQCARCCLSRPALDSCTAAFQYGGQLALALRRLKFNGRSDLAKTMHPLLLDRFGACAMRADLAIPIPLHKNRLRTRGFNQSQRLLLPLARHSRLPVARRTLQRVRDTPPQARLSAQERRANLRAAFKSSAAVAGKRILLFDDIRTTGSTLSAASRALRRAGAIEIHAFVVARSGRE